MDIDKEKLKINELEAELEFVKQKVLKKDEEIINLSTEIKKLQNELYSIRYSRSYKLTQKIKKVLGR